MKVEQIDVGNALRNFQYVLYNPSTSSAWAIDPFDAKQVIHFLEQNQLTLEMVVNTHLHFDHTRGNQGLIEKYQCGLYDLHSRADIELQEGYRLRTLFSPGHTMEHVTFILEKSGKQIGFFGGDNVFHYGVGNCKNGGNVSIFYETIQMLKSEIDPNALLYIGHDYGLSNLKFALSIENNAKLREELDKFENNPNRVFSFESELKHNPFLKCDKPEFLRLRGLRDNW